MWHGHQTRALVCSVLVHSCPVLCVFIDCVLPIANDRPAGREITRSNRFSRNLLNFQIVMHIWKVQSILTAEIFKSVFVNSTIVSDCGVFRCVPNAKVYICKFIIRRVRVIINIILILYFYCSFVFSGRCQLDSMETTRVGRTKLYF